MNDELRRLAKDVGGKHALDPRAFLLFTPVWLVASLLGIPRIAEPEVLLSALAANIGALALCVALVVVIRMVLVRGRKSGKVSAWLVIIAGAAIGATKGLVTAGILDLLNPGLEAWSLAPLRISASVGMGMWALPVLAIVMATRDRLKIERMTLISELVNQKMTSGATDDFLPADTRAQLVTFVEQVRKEANAGEHNIDTLAERIRTLSEATLRPLSHQLWRDASTRFTDYSVRDLLSLVVTRRRYATTWVVIAHAITTIPAMAHAVNIAEALARAALLAVLSVVILGSVSRLQETTFRRGLIQVLGSVVLIGIVNELAAVLLFGPYPNTHPALTASVHILGYVLGFAIFGSLSVARESQLAIREQLASLARSDGRGATLSSLSERIQRRDFAQYLHGRLQHDLLTLSLPQPIGPGGRSRADLLGHLDYLDLVLSGKEQIPLRRTVTGTAGLEEIARLWSGFATVVVEECTLPRTASAHLISTIGQVVEEGVANAIRHGLATGVSIHITSDEEACRIVVADDGVGPRAGSDGLGVALFYSVAGSRWSLSPGRDGRGSCLTVELPA